MNTKNTANPADAAAKSTAPATREKLLIVEDDPAIQRMISDYFRHVGYDILTASDGEAGARLALSERPTVMILDLMLPERSGLELLEDLHGRKRAPIIVLTARTDLPDRLRCFELGAVDFVPKPFFLEELVARIRAHLGQRGSKARTQDGPRAAKRLRILAAFALVGGGAGLICAPTIARLGAFPPMLLGIVVGWFVWRKEEKTTLGEVVAAAALSGAGFPIALAEGLAISQAALIWFVWTIAFGIATVCVRAVIARAKDAGPEPVVLAYVVTIGTILSSVGLALLGQLPMGVAVALAPFELLGFGVLVADVHTKHLRRVGWGLVAASLLTGGFVVAMLR